MSLRLCRRIAQTSPTLCAGVRWASSGTRSSAGHGQRRGRGSVGVRHSAPPPPVVDLAEQDAALDVEAHFQSVIEHVKATPTQEHIEGDLRVRRIQDDVRGGTIDGRPDQHKQSNMEDAPQKSFFDEGGMDIQGHGPATPGHRKNRKLDILGLSGTAGQSDAAVDSDGSLESISPSDPTIVEEDEKAYGNTPLELTDMLKERLLELKAEKLSVERDEAVLRRRLALPPSPASMPSKLTNAPRLQASTSTTPNARVVQRRSTTTLADEGGASQDGDGVMGASLQLEDANAETMRREQVSKFLQQDVPDLVPGMSSFDPFAEESGAEAFRGASARQSSSAEGVLLIRCMQRACLSSRREAIELVASGEVTVDGVVERNPFRRVFASNNVKVRGHSQRLKFAPSRLWVYHKPANVVVSRFDPAGRALFTKHAQLLGIDHVIPIGSLPYKSHGVLLLTNDGELADVLAHPKSNIQQSYHFRVKPAIDPVLANKLNTEGIRINEVLYNKAEFMVNHADRSRYYVKIRVRGETMPPHLLLGHLGRTIDRGGRVSFGPFALNGVPPGGVREVTVPPFFMKHVAHVWKPFIERDWPTHRRERVRRLQTLSKYRELRAKELEELDAFTFDEFKDALSYQSRELESEADVVARQLERQPQVDDTGLDVFTTPGALDERSLRSSPQQPHGPFSGGDVFVGDITRV